MKKLINNKFVQSAAVLLASTGAALASTSGGTIFQPISQGLGTVLSSVEDLSGFLIAGGVVAAGWLAFHDVSNHKKGFMTSVGAIVGGLAAANATQIAAAVSNSATIGHSSIMLLMLTHLPIVM